MTPSIRDDQRNQQVQRQDLPDYTSPPLDEAIEATPDAYRPDKVIDALRAAHSTGHCAPSENHCQIPFAPPSSSFGDINDTLVGVILYGGALVDPRAYSVLAHRLSHNYGIPTVIPVFSKDLAFTLGKCNEGRLALAQAEFPSVQKWIFVGHSLGGIGMMTDVWAESKNATDFSSIGGMVMLASYVRQDVGCGAIDFSGTSLPAASITATLDLNLNMTQWENNARFLPQNTSFVSIEGGNHVQFGSYNAIERKALFGKTDGVATVSAEEQQEIVVETIYGVAKRIGLDLPTPLMPSDESSAWTTSSTIARWVWGALTCLWILKSALTHKVGHSMLA